MNTILKKLLSPSGVIFAVIGVVGVVFSIYLAYVTRQFSGPSLFFTPGLTPIDERFLQEWSPRKTPVSTIVYGTINEKKQYNLIITIPYIIKNTGRQPIKNVSLKLTYSYENLIQEPSKVFSGHFLPHSKDSDKHFKVFSLASKENFEKHREFYRFRSNAIVDYKIDLIRVGESIVILDPIIMKYTENITKGKKENEIKKNYLPLTCRLKKNIKLNSYIVVSSSVNSEKVESNRKTFNVIWCDLNSKPNEKVWEHLLGNIHDAIWGMPRLEPGIYFKVPFTKEYNRLVDKARYLLEAVEMVFPYIISTTDNKGNTVNLELFDSSERCHGIIEMPTWDYRADFEGAVGGDVEGTSKN